MTGPELGPDLVPIAARLAAVAELVQRIADEVLPGTVWGTEPVIERHRPEVYAAMEAVGLAVYEFQQSGPSPERLEAGRALVFGTLREISLTSPIAFSRTQGSHRRPPFFELVEHVRAGKAAGADVPTRILDDYYVHTRIGEAFLNRLNLLNRRLLETVVACQTAGLQPLHLISLQYTGGDDLLPLARNPKVLANLQLTCVDNDVAAVRHAEQKLRAAFGQRIQLVMADLSKWLEGPTRPSATAGVVYAASLLEQLPSNRVIRILSGLHRAMRTGGVLLLGCTAGSVPVAERMIRDWLLGWDWSYRSESEWRTLFAQTPFGADHLSFEYEPLGINALIRVEKAE